MYTYIYTHTYTYTCVHAYVHIYTCMCVCVYWFTGIQHQRDFTSFPRIADVIAGLTTIIPQLLLSGPVSPTFNAILPSVSILKYTHITILHRLLLQFLFPLERERRLISMTLRRLSVPCPHFISSASVLVLILASFSAEILSGLLHTCSFLCLESLFPTC